jgi:hypothetical protein
MRAWHEITLCWGDGTEVIDESSSLYGAAQLDHYAAKESLGTQIRNCYFSDEHNSRFMSREMR